MNGRFGYLGMWSLVSQVLLRRWGGPGRDGTRFRADGQGVGGKPGRWPQRARSQPGRHRFEPGGPDVAPDLPAIQGDRAQLVEVLQNAIRYMGDQPSPRIDVGARREGSEPFVLTVEDNGIGIEPEYQEKIFELFQRLDAGTEGTGVGLALVKRIVELHGGRIRVESEGKGRGSTFCFTLHRGDLSHPPPDEAGRV